MVSKESSYVVRLFLRRESRCDRGAHRMCVRPCPQAAFSCSFGSLLGPGKTFQKRTSNSFNPCHVNASEGGRNRVCQTAWVPRYCGTFSRSSYSSSQMLSTETAVVTVWRYKIVKFPRTSAFKWVLVTIMIWSQGTYGSNESHMRRTTKAMKLHSSQ